MAAGLAEIGLLFFGVAVAGVVAARIGLSVIPLYLVAGVVLGPNVAGAAGFFHVPNGEVATIFGELGIVLLLFFLGLEFSITRLLSARRQISAAGAVDMAINLPLGIALGLVLGWTFVEALLLGGIVYISSSAIITKSLIDLGWIANPESEPILGTLVFEDLVVAVYLAVVASLVVGGDGLVGTAMNVGVALGFLVVLVLAVYYGGQLFERVLKVDAEELFVLRVLGIAVPVAALALSLGVSEAVAAFFVGMGFSTTHHRERIESLLTPIRDVFAAAFFFWIGLGTDPSVVVQVAGLLAIAVVLTAPAKVISGYYGGRLFDLDQRRSFRTGVAMVTRGEFSLIIAATAVQGTGEVMTQVIPAFAVGYVLVMSLLGSVLMQYSDRLEGLVLRRGTSA
ncbi:monovalent cation:H+ antiporter-2, CPA2 family [Halogranum gelatinilyticum]|uniref:Monovalent cation:H+ antiporter-2, CPA2 family n=1 Tax=Halogranum gelatinilyticum TaxID=660521 RepID=A0A1G9NZW7_9EURY|nr:cation:proton antiporter [Halogranum gelatinilyticum]SDL91924.1 monovalent cation:H+ antiporter-2, CPA2 family [Halogranum gelatinilyticum]